MKNTGDKPVVKKSLTSEAKPIYQKSKSMQQAKKEMIKKVEGITLITSDERDDDDFAEGWFVLRRKVLNTLKNSKEKG